MTAPDRLGSRETKALVTVHSVLGLTGTHYSPDYRETVERQNKIAGLALTYKWDQDAYNGVLFRSDARHSGSLLVHGVPPGLSPGDGYGGEDQLRIDDEDSEAGLPERVRVDESVVRALSDVRPNGGWGCEATAKFTALVGYSLNGTWQARR